MGSSEIYVRVDGDSPSYTMVGDAEIVASFGAGTVTGRLENFVVRERDTDGAYTFYETDGAIRIGGRRSEMGDDDFEGPNSVRPGVFNADYSGSIQTSDGSIRFDGDISGRFVGNRVGQPAGESVVRGVYAFGGSSDDATVDGEDAHIDISIAATATQ